MSKRWKNYNSVGKYAPRNRRPAAGINRPFWLPAPNFYILAAIIALSVFFVSWAVLNESEEEKPLISAGLLATMTLAGAVVLREVVLRSARYKLLQAQERIDHNINTVKKQHPDFHISAKLTLDENNRILRQIEKQSKAAKASSNIPESHWQVFELCHEYLDRAAREIEFAKIGSARIAVLRQSRDKIENLHKSHLLAWSSLESRVLLKEAKTCVTISRKLENANKALNVLDSALEFYPGDANLLESAAAVKEFIATVKVSYWIEQAERCAFKENYKRAISHYQDALFYLARENAKSERQDSIAEKISDEIEKMKKLASKQRREEKSFLNEGDLV